MTKKIIRVLAFLALGAAAAHAGAAKPAKAERIVLRSVKVHFPVASRVFHGSGSANTHFCLICHSAGMVTTQPPMPEGAWKVEVAKMKGAFGCPIPNQQVADELVSYFTALNNKKK